MKKTISILMLVVVSSTVILLLKSNSPSEHVTSATPASTLSPQSTSTTAPDITAISVAATAASASLTSVEADTTASTSPSKHSVHLPTIPALSQLPELPNGCEAVAATMLLNWAGLPITKEEVAHALPTGEMPYENEFGAFVGANPRDVFVGDPFDVGYGIYHTPIAAMMNQWLPGHIRDLTGTSFEDLLDVLAHGNPAMVWATEHMDMPYWDLEWEDEDGELVEWYQPEHALLLTGWDEDYAYMNDPMTGEQEAYPLEDFHKVWELMGSQAITIIS